MSLLKRSFRRMLTVTALLVCLILCLPAFGESTCPLIGAWSYDPNGTTIDLLLNVDGTAVYHSMICTWKDEDSCLTLRALNGQEYIIRYEQTDDRITVYPLTTYTRKETEDANGLIGSWYVPETPRVSFVFTADGAFSEDTAFSGMYTVDEEAGSFRLDYGGIFEPIVCYYTIEDDLLTVAYPWKVYPVN